MSRPLRIQYPDASYHVTCRGNERRQIFRDLDDQKTFFRLLIRSLDIFEVHLLAYALMSNHFHLLVCTPKANLSEFMRHFNISYTGAFNRKYKRSGHLYQGRYKAFLIDGDKYLLAVSRYIHLNPLRMKSGKLSRQKWQALLTDATTSLPGYLNQDKKNTFVHYETILNYFDRDSRKSRKEYKKFMAEGLEKELPNPLDQGKGAGIIGGEDFIAEVKEKFGRGQKDKRILREQPALRQLERNMKPEELIERYTQLVKTGREELTRKGKQSPERAMLMELLYRLCNITQPEIGQLLGGIDYSAVSQARKRFQVKIEQDQEWRKRFKRIWSELEQMSRIKI
ncbi:MAG: transposase [Smithella sp.]